MSISYYIIFAMILFSIGAAVVMVRRSAVISLMGVELMLNSANLTLITFARIYGDFTGQVMAFFVMIVAAAEVVVGLAIIVSIFRSRRTTSVDEVNLLKH